MRSQGLVLFTLLLPAATRRNVRKADSLQGGPGRDTDDLDAASGPKAKWATDEVPDANSMLEFDESVMMEQTNTQAELDKTFVLRADEPWELKFPAMRLKAAKLANERTKAASQPANARASEQASEQGKQATDPAEEKVNPLQAVKKFGVAGVASYALWEDGFWTVSDIVGPFADYIPFGVLSSQYVDLCGAAFVTLAHFAIPWRIGLTLISASPSRLAMRRHRDKNVIQREWFVHVQGEDIDWDSFAEEFEGLEGLDEGASESLNSIKGYAEMFKDAPLNTGSGIEVEMVFEKGDSGEPIVFSNWSFEVQARDFSDKDIVEELMKFFDFPLTVAGSSTFSLSEDGTVRRMKVGSWSVNEQVMPDLSSLESGGAMVGGSR